MHKIYFYKDKNGESQVKNYIDALASKNDKESRIKLTKIRTYLKILSERGTHIGEPYIKHLKGEIWELRPIKDRILFAAWDGNDFILLSYFIKKTKKTPIREIDKAKRLLNDFISRSKNNEL